MGFIHQGHPMLWAEVDDATREKVRVDGLKQLAHIWSLNESRHDANLYWGDEQEYTMLHLDHEKQEAKILLEAPRVLQLLRDKEQADNWDESLLCCKQLFLKKPKKTFLRSSDWHNEFGRHMIEATPSPPFQLSVEGLLDIEESMISRRLKLQEVLSKEYTDVYAASVTTLPNFGALSTGGQTKLSDKAPFGSADYIYQGESHELISDEDLSDFLSGSVNIIKKLPNPVPRFPTLVHNVNARRGTKVSGLFPVENTEDLCWAKSLPTVPKSREKISEQSRETVLPVKGYAYADSFAHGMSMCCLQVTFGSHNLEDSLYLYDQMVVLAPIFLALSAATPVLFGHLSTFDTRWKVLEQTCDCRTEEELSVIPQSRYGCAPMYISDDEYLRENEDFLNDDLMPMNESAFETLQAIKASARGASLRALSDRVMRHFATLWLRDPIVIYSDAIDMDNTRRADHFENLQSTNWNTVRFKLPPPSADGKSPSTIGWRVELRTPDLQLSDFQNAALAGIASILSLAIQKEHWNFYIPMSQVRQNLESASKKASCLKKKFWWPTNRQEGQHSVAPTTTPRSLASIFLDEADGLLKRLDQFVSSQWRQQACSSEAVQQYRVYAAFIKNRVLGREPTNAATLRRVIDSTRPTQPELTSQQAPTQPVTLKVVSQSGNDMTAGTTTTAAMPSPAKVVKYSPAAVTPSGEAVCAKNVQVCFTESDLPRVNHALNYKMMKYAVLAGYDRDVINTGLEVHSSLQNTPSELHICNKSPVLSSLTRLLSDTIKQQLPSNLVVLQLPSNEPGSATLNLLPQQQQGSQKSSSAETVS